MQIDVNDHDESLVGDNDDESQKRKLKTDPEEALLRDDSADEADYYMENGLLVFTRSYHLKRGYCCGSGCRHCPYGKR
jgi:hypothetical protein